MPCDADRVLPVPRTHGVDACAVWVGVIEPLARDPPSVGRPDVARQGRSPRRMGEDMLVSTVGTHHRSADSPWFVAVTARREPSGHHFGPSPAEPGSRALT